MNLEQPTKELVMAMDEKATFRVDLLEKILREIELINIKKKNHRANTFSDWQRCSQIYSVSGRSINEITNNQQFENTDALRDFFSEHLLNQIEDPVAKKVLLEVFFLGLHQGGFTHAFGRLSAGLTTAFYHKTGIFYGHANKKVNFIPLKNGIKIEEFTSCSKKMDRDGKEIPIDGNYYQTSSCICLMLTPLKKNGRYRLKAVINEVKVIIDPKARELEPYFSKKARLLSARIEFLLSPLLALIRRVWNGLVAFIGAKEGVVLDGHWLARSPYMQKKAAPVLKPTSKTFADEAANDEVPIAPQGHRRCFWSGAKSSQVSSQRPVEQPIPPKSKKA